MAGRALWTGSIAFGLVNIPIGLHRALRDTRPRFHLLHAKDKSRIRLERVCERDGRPVSWNDLVKGYEYAKGKFVILTKEDIHAAALEKTNTLDILDFVDGQAIDDRFFETPYYALPAKGGERAYAVLRDALRDSGKTGVGKIMLRETQHLAAVESLGEALVVTMMRFPDELADLSDFKFPKAMPHQAKELRMAKTLIDQFSDSWSPDKYTDEYQANLMRLIRAKMKGKEVELAQAEPDERQGQVIDLMEKLRQSLGGGRSAASERHGRKAAAGQAKSRPRRGRKVSRAA